MLLTEPEAKTKLCCGPDGCGHADYKGSNQAGGAVYGDRMCVGSACMGWRWHSATSWQSRQTEDERRVEFGRVTYVPKPPEGDGWRQIHEWEGDPPKRKMKEPKNVGYSSWHRPGYGPGIAWPGHGPRGHCGLSGAISERNV